MPKQISDGRKAAYYLGNCLTIFGFLMFASTFVTFLMHFGDFSNFEARAKSNGLRAIGGMALIVVGAIISGIGSRGLAGSGVILDPERARNELEPYSRMAGGMVADALDEAQINLGSQPEKVIMVKCQSCGSLSQETAKFCQECGQKL